MDLGSLTQPAILCQCLRCSSSLAVLENEWAKLSSSYSLATAWLSVNLHRISISSERKQIPNTSDMTLLRERIIQEISCKLCQQKLGVLCELDNGKTPQRDRNSIQDGALIPAGTSDLYSVDPLMQRQMQHQGRSIDQISTSVNHLQDTMTDLKHSFTALRIELNGPSRHLGETGNMNGQGFDMIATVLKELKSKSEEIEKLKLEIEALKLKNRFIEEFKQKDPGILSAREGKLPEVQSPGLLQAGRKRAWPDAFSTGGSQVIADSFDEEDMIDDLSLENLPTYSVRVPTKHSGSSSASTSQYRLEAGHRTDGANGTGERADNTEKSTAKRPRLTQTNEENGEKIEKRRPGRPPRKSMTQPTKPVISQPADIAPSDSRELVVTNTSTQVPTANSSPGTEYSRRGRPRLRRSTRGQSMGPVEARDRVGDAGGKSNQVSAADDSGKGSDTWTNADNLPKGHQSNMTNGVKSSETEAEEKRRAKIAMRDVMIQMAMQREETMETDETR
ncbi:hypothetical protein N7462_000773 [Penicillium macrosclerotiorum]|uniref:uncharacterized protein n=1 Tax=Penicillium macrosclerotiorum TaxID=303699 RepID=UPI002546D11C|nr:uncharacterized protein N7462_000773 [Penicillium macrosclerotiorum]KAJ5698768.1 hypothetical protein N7462_000773 [Penicillium macrosclerotiorum]